MLEDSFIPRINKNGGQVCGLSLLWTFRYCTSNTSLAADTNTHTSIGYSGKLETAPLYWSSQHNQWSTVYNSSHKRRNSQKHESHWVCLKLIIPGGQLWLVAWSTSDCPTIAPNWLSFLAHTTAVTGTGYSMSITGTIGSWHSKWIRRINSGLIVNAEQPHILALLYIKRCGDIFANKSTSHVVSTRTGCKTSHAPQTILSRVI